MPRPCTSAGTPGVSTQGVRWLALAWLLVGCASAPQADVIERVNALLPADLLLLGEQHDADAHQAAQRAVVQALGARGRLAAVAMEMAERGRSTAGLASDASQAEARAALAWNDQAWPWARYGPVVMAAVRAGIPVAGANLPRTAMREAMRNADYDRALDASALAAQQQSIRDGHCGLLPEPQIGPMTRVQIARDVAMGEAGLALRRPGQVVLLIAGAGHVRRDLGIARHLPAGVQARTLLLSAGAPSPALAATADAVQQTPPLPPQDYCARLRR